MKIKQIVALLISAIAIFFTSCNTGQQNRTSALSDGWLVGYYEDGSFRDSTYIKDGIISGVQILRDSSTGKWIERSYKLGKKFGIERGYYADGNLLYEGMNFEGHKQREWLWFYRNGTLKHYKYYESEGGLIFRKEYDAEGNVLFASPFTFGYFTVDSVPVCINDTLYFNAFFPKPPNTSLKVIYFYDGDEWDKIGYKVNMSSDLCFGYLPPAQNDAPLLTFLWEYFDEQVNEDTIKGRVSFEIEYDFDC